MSFLYRRRSCATRLKPATPAVEGLERRLFKSATLANGVLTVTGTSGDDHITVSLHPGDNSRLDVDDNGTTSTFNLSDVDKVEVHAGKGNDVVDVDQANGAVTKPIEMFGGQGDDSLTGGDGDDSLHGGMGHDLMDGDAGDDSLDGGRGHDEMHGGKGDDTLNGDAGDDSMMGGDGNDDMNGGDGNDDMHGGVGNDTCMGDNGDDSVRGGAGDDNEDGGAGTDEVHGGPGRNAFADDDQVGTEIKDKNDNDTGGHDG